MACHQILCLVFLSAFVFASGFSLDELRIKRQTETGEDCSRPPTNGHINLCCKLPKERIWGDLRSSFKKCFNKAKMERRAMRQEMMGADGDEKATTTAQGDDIEAVTEATSEEPVTTPGFAMVPVPKQPGRRRLRFSETAKDVFTSMYKIIKDTYDVLRDSVIMLTDHFHHRRNDQCVMECVFQDQGLLSDKVVNKEALVRRLHLTLGRNEIWHSVAIDAVEKCHQTDLGIPANGTCQSGSEEMFRCVLKHIFFNCPSWPEKNEYCRAVKEFYQRCPNGPPPPLEDKHTTPEPDEETEIMTTIEPEQSTQE